MKTLAEHLNLEDRKTKVACPSCGTPTAAFAITRDDNMKWRCGHCRVDYQRAVVTVVEALGPRLSWDDIRGKRKVEMERTDWSELPRARAAMGKKKADEWDSYRQALRDITNSTTDPAAVIWPIAPDRAE